MSTTITSTPSTSAHRTFGNPAAVSDMPTPTPTGWTRRGFLGALSAVTVATVSGCGIAGDDELDMGGGNGRGLGPGRGGGPATADGSPYTPVAPFGLAAVCELSEDYFLVENHLIDPAKDTVMAYSRADGLVEAIVLQGGVVKQIYRDPTQSGGWNVNPLPDADGVTHMVAGVSAPLDAVGRPLPGPPSLRIFYTKAQSDQLWVATQTLVDGKTSTAFGTQQVPWTDHAADLQITFNANETLLVSAMKPSTGLHSGDAQLWFCHDTGGKLNQGTMTGFSYDPAAYGNWAAVGARFFLDGLAPQLYLYLPGGVDQNMNEDANLHLWRAPLAEGPLVGTLQDSRLGAVKPPPHLDIIDVAYLTALRSQWMPTALIWTVHDSQGDHAGGPQLWAVTWDGDAWAWTELVLPASINHDVGGAFPISTALTPRSNLAQNSQPARQLLDVFMVANDTLHVLRQIEQANADDDTKHPVYTPLIPLQPGAAAMTSQAAVSTGNELLVVGTDKVLQTLEKDPVSGRWTDAEIQVPATSLQQDSAYRVSLTLTDTAWNAPVTNQPLSITASTPAPASVAGPSGPVTVFLGADPVTLTTDDDGEVMIALLADGLSAPTLTVTTTGLPKPVNVYPSAAVNTYMQGDGTLNYLPTMNSDTLSSATTTDGLVVPKGTADVGTQVATMKQAATWGADGSADGTVSSTFGRVDGGRTYGTPHHQRRSGANLGTKALGSNIDNWAHDVFHAIKKGATSVEKIAVDVEQKIVTFVTDAAGWADKEVHLVIKTIEDAAHVLHAAFNKLGAAIVHAVKWLAAEVIGTLTDAVALAHQYDTWLQQCCTFLGTQAKTDASAAVQWLAAKRVSVKADLVAIANSYAPGANLSNMADTPPRGVRSSRQFFGRSQPGDDDSDQSTPHSDWFLSKVKRELFGELTLPSVSGIEDLMKQLLTAAGQALEDFKDAFDHFTKFLVGVITHPTKVRTLGVKDLMLAVADLVDAMFILAQAIMTVSLEILAKMASVIPTILGTELGELGILGKILSTVGLGKVTLGTVISIVFAFPAVVAHKITHGGKGRPFDHAQLSRTRSGLGSGDIDHDLASTAGVALITWANLDVLSCLAQSSGADPGGFFTALDIAAPVIVGFLTIPSTQGGQPYFSPPVTGNGPDELNFVAWLAGIAPAGFEAAELYLEHSGQNDPDLPAQKSMVSFAVSAMGVFALGTGCQANHDTSPPSGAAYASAVLNSMADICAPPSR